MEVDGLHVQHPPGRGSAGHPSGRAPIRPVAPASGRRAGTLVACCLRGRRPPARSGREETMDFFLTREQLELQASAAEV
ncbi:MAG TPA: hypothetical protein VLC53_07630, partial [Myxococcota bacterium]|nr:hypothetical protein [Myxococcota bacterium]